MCFWIEISEKKKYTSLCDTLLVWYLARVKIWSKHYTFQSTRGVRFTEIWGSDTKFCPNKENAIAPWLQNHLLHAKESNQPQMQAIQGLDRPRYGSYCPQCHFLLALRSKSSLLWYFILLFTSLSWNREHCSKHKRSQFWFLGIWGSDTAFCTDKEKATTPSLQNHRLHAKESIKCTPSRICQARKWVGLSSMPDFVSPESERLLSLPLCYNYSKGGNRNTHTHTHRSMAEAADWIAVCISWTRAVG